MALLDALTTRVTAILGGTHAATAAIIPPGTFTAGQVFLPHQNPEWPSGAAKAALNRRWDLMWKRLRFDGPDPRLVNARQGTWVRLASFDLRLQYEFVRPTPLAPRDKELTLGALEVATRRAIDDLAQVEFSFYQPGAWTSVAINFELDGEITATKADEVRVVGVLPGLLRVSQSATTAPGLWT